MSVKDIKCYHKLENNNTNQSWEKNNKTSKIGSSRSVIISSRS